MQSIYLLDFEIEQNPYAKQKIAIKNFIRNYATVYVDIDKSDLIAERAKMIMESGIKYKDAIHVVSAIEAGCDYLISTDKRLLKYKSESIRLMNPMSFLIMRG